MLNYHDFQIIRSWIKGILLYILFILTGKHSATVGISTE